MRIWIYKQICILFHTIIENLIPNIYVSFSCYFTCHISLNRNYHCSILIKNLSILWIMHFKDCMTLRVKLIKIVIWQFFNEIKITYPEIYKFIILFQYYSTKYTSNSRKSIFNFHFIYNPLNVMILHTWVCLFNNNLILINLYIIK